MSLRHFLLFQPFFASFTGRQVWGGGSWRFIERMNSSLPGMLAVNPGGSWGGDIWWFIALTGAGWSPGGCGRFCSPDGPTLFPSLGPLPNSAFCVPGTRLEFFGPAFCIPGTRLEFFGPRFSMAAILFISTTNPFSFFTI